MGPGFASGQGRARKSLGTPKSVACKVSAWRNPRDKPSRASSASAADKPEATRCKYEGPDQDLAAQLERCSPIHSEPDSCSPPHPSGGLSDVKAELTLPALPLLWLGNQG